MRRRKFLKLAGAAGTAGIFAPSVLRAQAAWPDRPVKMIVPFAAGGATDLVARPWAEAFGKAFGQQFVIENRGGASGMIGAEAAARSAPDGYTFFFTSNTTTVTLPLIRKLSYDAASFIPVARMGDSMGGFAMSPTVPAKTFHEMVAYAKANPGKLACGTSGSGTLPHLRYEMLRYKMGIDILNVPYRGGAETLQDILAGNIQLMNEASTLPHVKAGKLTMLCVNSPERFVDLPDIPTLTECGVKDADMASWFGLYAPPGTPKEIVERLNAKMIEISGTPEWKQKMVLVACIPETRGLAELQQLWDDDWKSTEQVIKAAGIKLE
jgi:tripartite-type tricarboxylate transporter receptor subunit TctC